MQRRKKETGGWALVTASLFFGPPGGQFPVRYSAKSSASTLEAATGETVSCTQDASSGEVTGPLTVGDVTVTFTGCKGKSGSTTCTANSPSAKEGQVVTSTLKGELGAVEASEASSLVGLLLEPASGHSIVTIEGSCLVTAAVEGSLAGEDAPLGVLSTTSKLIFSGSAGSEKIKAIEVLGLAVKPKLDAFGLVAASEATSEELTFQEVVEVE
jgi:hypothetical protein